MDIDSYAELCKANRVLQADLSAAHDEWFVWDGDDPEHRGFVRREDISFDSDPQFWREVPVEELEQEAADD